MTAVGEPQIWRDRADAGALLARRLAPGVHHHQDTTVIGIPPGGIAVAASLAAELQLPLSSWSVQRLWLPGGRPLSIGALAPGNIQLLDVRGIQRLRLDAEVCQALLRRQAGRLARDQRRFGDPGPAELRHRHLIVVDEAIRSGLAMAAALMSLRALYPASITVAAPLGCLEAIDRLGPLADRLVVLRPLQRLASLSDWFASLPPLQARDVIALLRDG